MQLPVYEDVVAAGEFMERSGKHAGLSIFKVWLRGNPRCLSYHFKRFFYSQNKNRKEGKRVFSTCSTGMYYGYIHPLSFIRELIMRMNKLLISVLAIGLLIGVATDSRAHLNVVGDTGEDYGGLLVAYGFAENEIPTLNADIGDWEATITDPVFWITTEAMTSNDFWGTGATYNLDNLAVRFALGWAENTNRLYLGAEVFDNLYISETLTSGIFDTQSDNIEWNVDADHSGGPYACLGLEAEEETRWAYSQAQQIVLDPFHGVTLFSAGASWVAVPPYMDAANTTIGEHNSGPASFIYEAYTTPWDDLNPAGASDSIERDLQAGEIVHMQVNVADFDSFNEEGRAVYYAYPNLGGGSTWNNADNFVDFLLASPSGATAVETDSWGAIKSTFAQ